MKLLIIDNWPRESETQTYTICSFPLYYLFFIAILPENKSYFRSLPMVLKGNVVLGLCVASLSLMVAASPGLSLGDDVDLDDPDLQLAGEQQLKIPFEQGNSLAKRSLPFEEFSPISETQEIDNLEDHLIKSWKELDRMLFCTKLPMCVIR